MYGHKFPAGIVTVEIKAHAYNTTGGSPIMVAGVGANYSQVWQFANEQSHVYSFTTTTTENEHDLTIRFPYDGQIYDRINQQNGNVGELKLYVDEVKLIIKTKVVPKTKSTIIVRCLFLAN
jgi:hypothetical protein